MIKRHQDASEHMNEEQRVSWVVSPPTPSKQEDSEGCIAGIYPVPSWLRTHLSQKFHFELSHTHYHPTFPGGSLTSSIHYGKDQHTAFLLLSTRAACFGLILTSWLSSQMEVWVFLYSPRGSIRPPWVRPCCEKRDYRVLLYSSFLSSSSPGKMSQQLLLINSPSVISNAN